MSMTSRMIWWHLSRIVFSFHLQADSKVAEKLATVEVKKSPPKPASSELFYYIHIGYVICM